MTASLRERAYASLSENRTKDQVTAELDEFLGQKFATPRGTWNVILDFGWRGRWGDDPGNPSSIERGYLVTDGDINLLAVLTADALNPYQYHLAQQIGSAWFRDGNVIDDLQDLGRALQKAAKA